MGVFAALTSALLYLAALAVDIVAVFLIARLLSRRMDWRWLLAFDGAGRPLTDLVLEAVDRRFSRDGLRMREEARIGLALLALFLARMLCAVALGVLNR